MKNTTTKKTILSIIRQREFLIKKSKCKKNVMKCLEITKHLKVQIVAFSKIWDKKENAWFDFFKRNEAKILYLIPNNNSGKSLKNKLYENS
jgi:hypothetical protein